MQTIAIVNEKGGTAKTTTSVNLAAALGEMGKKVLLVDLDGQAASSRWLGVEEDSLLADAILRGRGLEPLENVIPGVSLAPASGKLDSVAHDLRPTQGGQLRKLLHEVEANYDYILIDCPPSLGNRLIGNALLAASHAIAPVEMSVLALDGLRILLTMLEDIRDGFGHEIKLIGVLACRYDDRTRLSRLVLAELKRALPEKVFETVIRENTQIQECPASGRSILEYAPDCSAAEDYRRLARELVAGAVANATADDVDEDLAQDEHLTNDEHVTVVDFRKQMNAIFGADAQPESDETDDGATPDAARQLADPPVELTVPQTPAEQGADDYEIVSVTPTQGDSEPDPPAPEEEPTVEDRAAPEPPPAPVEQDETAVAPTPAPAPEPEPEPAKPPAPTSGAETPKRIPPKPYRPRWGKRRRRIIEAAIVVLVIGAVFAARYVLDDDPVGPEPTGAQVAKTVTPAAPKPPPRPAKSADPGTADVDPPATPPTVDPPTDPLGGVYVDPVTPPGLADPPTTPKKVDPRGAEIDVDPPSAKPPKSTDDPTTIGEAVTSGEKPRGPAGKTPGPTTRPTGATTDPSPAGPKKPSDPAPLPTAVARKPFPPPAEPKPKDAPDKVERYQTCPPGYDLTCVLKSGGGRWAIINGRIVDIGQSVRGAKVIKIFPSAAELELNGKRFMLRIGGNQPGGMGGPSKKKPVKR